MYIMMDWIKIRKYVENLPKTINKNGCWIPNRIPDTNGYVRVMINGHRLLLSRLTLTLYHNVNYDNQIIFARHKCNNPPCFNPEHINPGTHSDNMFDSVKSGTHKEARKTSCSTCGRLYHKIKCRVNGKIVWKRRCHNCDNISHKAKRLRDKNESK